MGKGIIGLSFDDGRGDNRKVAEYLLSLNIPATFNITTGYIDGTCPPKMLPSEKRPITMEDVCWMHNQKIFEIALHGDKHLNSAEDITSGRKKIIKWLGLSVGEKFGFASPGTGLDMELIKKERKLFYDQISYVRLALRIKKMYWIRVISRKASRVLHQPFLYRTAYTDTLMDKNEERKIIYSVPVLRDTTFKEIEALIRVCVKKEKILVLMFHSVEKDSMENDAWSWSEEKFQKLCEYMIRLRNEEKINILNVRGIYEYKE